MSSSINLPKLPKSSWEQFDVDFDSDGISDLFYDGLSSPTEESAKLKKVFIKNKAVLRKLGSSISF